MEQFLTWQQLGNYMTFVSVVFMIVEFFKEIKYIKTIPTKYFAAIVSLTMLILLKLATSNFLLTDIPLYIINALVISLGSNGLANVNKKLNKE